MKVASLCLLVLSAISLIGCSGAAPTAEKPTGEIDKGATDLSSAKPSNPDDKFNRYNAPD